MPRTASSTAKTKTRASRAPNAITMLTEDHAKVRKMFKQFEKAKEGGAAKKEELVRQICAELTVHTQLEEEIFYPAAREALQEHDLPDEAEVEHASAKSLIEQLSAMQPEDDLYDAKVTVLAEYVEHHVKEEEKQLFPKVRKARVDLDEMADRMSARKSELMGQGA